MMESNQWIILVLILALDLQVLLAFASVDIHTHINVSSKAGKDNESCLTNFSQPCRTLGYVMERLENFTMVQVSNGIYHLDKNYNITNKQNIWFIGESSEVEIKCNRSAVECGLWFQRCEELQFDSLTFDGCGHLQLTSPAVKEDGKVYYFYAGISFIYCKDLQIEGCTFKNSRGTAMVLYNTGGRVNVIGSQFINNPASTHVNISHQVKSKITDSGGGIHLNLDQYGLHTLYNNNSNYTFQNVTFQENSYMENKSNPKLLPFGSGLRAFFYGSAQKNSMLIESCNFTSNKAYFGGGVFVEFHDETQGNSLFFKQNTFWKNQAIYGGGGIRTGNDILEQGNKTLKENEIMHKGNRLDQNSAALGGALSHYGWTYHQQSVNDQRYISLEDCHFLGNEATMGAAIAVALNVKNRWVDMGSEMPYALELVNCTVTCNVANHAKRDIIGMGAVYTSQVPCILKGNNTFFNNSNSAFILDNAPLKVHGEASFKGNVGYKGGALAIYGMSRLILTKNSHLIFKFNKAKERGGAIYIRTPGPDVVAFSTTRLGRHKCFIAYEENGTMINIDQIKSGVWKTKLDFMNNSAPSLYGNSIYATTLQFCYLAEERNRKNTALEWKEVITYSGSTEQEISTDPVAIEFNPSEWSSLAPNEKFDASIRLIDEKDNTVSGVVKIRVKDKMEQIGVSGTLKIVKQEKYPPSIYPESSLFLVQTFKSANNKTKSIVSDLRVKGVVGDNFTIEILTSTGQVVSRQSELMNISNCLDGFQQTSKMAIATGKCICMKDIETHHEGVSQCLDDGKTVYLKTGYWGGQINNHGEFVTYPCPPGYCKFDETAFEFVYNKKTICVHNRSSESTLCGKCKTNFSLSLGSEECIRNTDCEGKVWTIDWGIPVFLFVVPFFVILLLRLNVDIFTSYLSAWLYFYQVLPFVVQNLEILDGGMQVILDFTSWRLPSTHISCFLKDLDNVDKLLFNFLFPLYVLTVLLLITWFARFGCCSVLFNRCCRFLQHVNVYRAISTILVLCYAQLTLISFKVCRWVKIGTKTDVLFIQGSIYASEDGSNIPASYYVALVIAIVVILCFVIVFPLTLIFSSQLGRRIRFLSNFMGLFDVFQNCFKNEYRWFSAYYFICRIAVFLLTAALSIPGPRKRCLIEILMIFSLAILSFSKPYRDSEDSNLRWLNIVDTLILTNLCIITVMSTARNSEASEATRKSLKYGIRFLSWLPMVYLFVLIALALRHYCNPHRLRRDDYEDLDDPSSNTPDSSDLKT